MQKSLGHSNSNSGLILHRTATLWPASCRGVFLPMYNVSFKCKFSLDRTPLVSVKNVEKHSLCSNCSNIFLKISLQEMGLTLRFTCTAKIVHYASAVINLHTFEINLPFNLWFYSTITSTQGDIKISSNPQGCRD